MVMLTFLSFMWTRRVGKVNHAGGDPFHLSFLEIVQVVTTWHLSILLFDYPVSAKLESVGLGGLEVIAAAAFAVTIAPLVMRLRKTRHLSKPDDGSNPHPIQLQTDH
jgi:hypothetical protein